MLLNAVLRFCLAFSLSSIMILNWRRCVTTLAVYIDVTDTDPFLSSVCWRLQS